MAYTETGDELTFFEERENELIKEWLSEHGYTWGHNTVCGSCCGMYEDEYWVNHISGKFKKADAEEFKKFAKEKNISCSVSGNTISASVE